MLIVNLVLSFILYKFVKRDIDLIKKIRAISSQKQPLTPLKPPEQGGGGSSPPKCVKDPQWPVLHLNYTYKGFIEWAAQNYPNNTTINVPIVSDIETSVFYTGDKALPFTDWTFRAKDQCMDDQGNLINQKTSFYGYGAFDDSGLAHIQYIPIS